MNVLAFDTCFGACSVAVMRSDSAQVITRVEQISTGHAERLIPMIGDVLSEAELELRAINRIAVTNGPGTFTGMRIGIAAARAFSLAHAIPIVSFTSLEVMAHDPTIPQDADVVVAVDAHRGEIYAQKFARGARAPMTPPELLSPDQIVTLSFGDDVVTVGSGAPLVAVVAEAQRKSIRTEYPALLPLIQHVLTQSVLRAPDAQALKPLYLRAPDAKPQIGKSLARVSP